jgi:hypothetical protein
MPFEALDKVWDRRLGPLPGPNGKTYYIPEADAEFGLWCVRAFALVERAANGEPDPAAGPPPQLHFEGPEEEAMQRRALGAEQLEQLRADGFGLPTINHFTTTAIVWHAQGREMAEMYWNAGGDPARFQTAALQRLPRAARRASTNGGAASTTKTPGSTSGTRSRKGSSPK